MEQTSVIANDNASNAGNGLQHQAVLAAKEAFLSLSDGNVIFQQCIASTEPISTVVQSLLAKHGSHTDKRSARLLEKFQKYTLWLQNMASAIDVAVNSSSGIACPIWAPIKYILKLSRDHYEALEHVVRMIETISDCLPRVKIYAKLNAHPMLQTTFLQLFTSIIDFSVVALRYLNRNVFSRAMGHIGRDLEFEFGDAMDRLRRHARAVHEMAVATELQQAAQYRQNTEKIYQRDLRIRCSEWLRPSNVREIHSRQLNERLTGTCGWIQDHAAYAAWSSPSPGVPPILLICGKPGCGKSILASALLEHAESQAKNVLYFPFSNGDSTRRHVKDLVRSLIWQALDAADDKVYWDMIHGLMSRGTVLASELWDLLGSILSLNQNFWFLIVDGVDECTELDELLREKIPGLLRSNGKLQAAILGRPQILQHRKALGFTALIEITPKMVRHDIESFISAKVDDASLLRDHISKDLVIKSLQRESEGMFLWVRLVIQDLQKSSTAAEVYQRMGRLPKGLVETYKQVFKHLHDSLHDDELKIHLVRNTLACTIACGRPMSFRELRYALALNARMALGGIMQPLEDYLIQYSAEELVGICGNLIVISNDQVLLIHTSLGEFLLEAMDVSTSQTDAQVKAFCVTDNEAHRFLGETCLDYLQLQDYGLPWQDPSSLSEMRVQNALLEYSAKYFLFHISCTETPCHSLMESVLGFIRSRFFVSWVEHFFMDMADDEELDTIVLDFEEFIAWTHENSKEDEVCTKMKSVLRTELRRRQNTLGEDHPSTQRWMLFTGFALDFFLTEPLEIVFQPGFEEPRVDIQMPTIHGLVISPGVINIDNLASQTMRMLGEGRLKSLKLPCSQMDVILRVYNLVRKARTLTDPLEMLFKLLRRKATHVPVFALFMVWSFYLAVGKEENGLEVMQAALKKVENSDTWLEFKVLDSLASFHEDRYEYEQCLPYLSRLIAGLLRKIGHFDSTILELKMSLGHALRILKRVGESETVYQELIDLNRRYQVLDLDLLLRIFVNIARCRADIKDYEGEMAWCQKAMDLPDAARQYASYSNITYIGFSLYCAQRYEEALCWLEDTNVGPARGGPLDRRFVCERDHYHGLTLYKLHRYDESLSLLQKALISRETVVEKANLPRKLRIMTKDEMLLDFYDLGFESLFTENYHQSLEYYQTVNKAWKDSSDMHQTKTFWSQVYRAASFYGLDQIEQGIQLLQGLLKEISAGSYDMEDKFMNRFIVKYLLGFGISKLKTSPIIEASAGTSLQTLPPFGPKKQRSLDDIRSSKSLKGGHNEWRHFLKLARVRHEDFPDLFLF